MSDRKVAFDAQNSGLQIRFATYSDIPAIMKFIKEYWSENHILANCREMFEYQYVYGEETCFVISVLQETGEIEGVLGYIPYDTEGDRDIFTALWKVKPSKNLFQGIELLYYLEEHGRCRNLYCAGINPKTFSIYRYMRKQIAKLDHYYILNESFEISDYRIAGVKRKSPVVCQSSSYTAKIIENVDQLLIFSEDDGRQVGAFKSREYVKRRYFEHPVYQYEVVEVCVDEGMVYLVTREQECNGHRVLRIVDLWGDEAAFSKMGAYLKTKLKENIYEYVDLYAYGMNEIDMEKSGFSKVVDEDDTIIPNYFEPFVKENIPIHIFVPKDKKVRMFKGDGDQDRPNHYL